LEGGDGTLWGFRFLGSSEGERAFSGKKGYHTTVDKKGISLFWTREKTNGEEG